MWTSDLTQLEISAEQQQLLTTKFLSKFLQTIYSKVTVQKIAQGLYAAQDHEKQCLNINEDQSFVREVFLVGNTEAVVYARVVAPLATYYKFQTELDSLGKKLIGEHFLYKFPNFKRSAFEYARLDYQGSLKPARRSVFDLDSYQLLITEIFIADCKIEIPATSTRT